MGYHARTLRCTLKLKTGAELARAWAGFARAAKLPPEMPADPLAYLSLRRVGDGNGIICPEHSLLGHHHVYCRILDDGAWCLFESGGELLLSGEDGTLFGLRITESGVRRLVGLVGHVTWVDQDDDDADDDADERTETCARCAEEVPADDVGAGQLCSWCTQLCR
jgi:hypothetical protein